MILATGASPWGKAVQPSPGAPRATEVLRQPPAAKRTTCRVGPLGTGWKACATRASSRGAGRPAYGRERQIPQPSWRVGRFPPAAGMRPTPGISGRHERGEVGHEDPTGAVGAGVEVFSVPTVGISDGMLISVCVIYGVNRPSPSESDVWIPLHPTNTTNNIPK